LLARRRVDDGAPPWVLPGGKIEPSESPETAAVREALEETGLTVKAGRLLGERVHPDTENCISYVACVIIAGAARVTAPGEVDAVRWVPFSELPTYVPGGLYEAVQVYLDGMPGAAG